MGKDGKKPKVAATGNKPDLEPHGDSRQRQLGRRLVLSFVGAERPELEKIEFRYAATSKAASFDRKLDPHFSWTAVPQALSLLCLDYFCHSLRTPRERFVFRGEKDGSPAASLGNAKYVSSGFIHDLFVNHPVGGMKTECFDEIIKGRNIAGKEKGDRSLTIDSEFLPVDCVEVYWDIIGPKPLPDADDVKRLADQIRISLKLPIPPEAKGSDESQTQTVGGRAKRGSVPKTAKQDQANPQEARSNPETGELPPGEQFKFGKWLAGELGDALKILRNRPEAKPDAPKPKTSPPETETATPGSASPAEDSPTPRAGESAAKAGDSGIEGKTSATPPAEEVPLARIDPELFKVAETNLVWPDDMPLIAWDEDEAPHIWKLKNSFEGVLIMGATGSGKSSGSGATIAETFLRSGFGGLVMTCKTDEAERWRRLCVQCGREGDFVAVRRGGDWKLNVLAYEAQQPGRGAGLSENLTSFCRNLLHVSTRWQGTKTGDPVWETAGNQLLNATFDLFLLVGGSLSFDRLAEFVSAAPTGNLPGDDSEWLKIPIFGALLAKAKNSISSPEDKRLFGRATDYWFKIYPSYPARIRTSVTLGIFAMFDAFRGRDIPALISSDTNITPESIMAGKIVVVDLPLKELHHTGLLVQCAWKYLFQTALERHTRTGDPRRRPVFLWEDEAQYFFSDHDHQFQDTARSARVCRVILTQNLPGFYKEFGPHGTEAANSVFGNLNTKIFHANSEPATNEWAAKHFGHEIHHRVTISHNPPPPSQPSGNWGDALLSACDPPQTTGISATEHWEYAVRPEEFNRLRVGGPENDFQVDAYITWVGASGENERHFTLITFKQNPNL